MRLKYGKTKENDWLVVGMQLKLSSRFQMLHVHVFLVTPLSTCHMPESGADQHEGRVLLPVFGGAMVQQKSELSRV